MGKMERGQYSATLCGHRKTAETVEGRVVCLVCGAYTDELPGTGGEGAGKRRGKPEAAIQDTIAQAFQLDGWVVLRINGGAMHVDGRYVRFVWWAANGYGTSDKGVSDLIVTKGKRTAYIECKAEGGRQSDAQYMFQAAVEDAGGYYVVARSIDDVSHMLDRMEAA